MGPCKISQNKQEAGYLPLAVSVSTEVNVDPGKVCDRLKKAQQS